MMKSLTTALGALTILTVTGMATPPGQAMLGIQHAQTSSPVSVIADPGPAKVATPALAPVAAPATVAPRAAAPAPRPAVAAPAARPVVTHPAAAPAPVASAPAPAAAPGGPMGGGAGQIANILLNLPQVLGQGTQVPGIGNGDEGTPPRAKKEHKHQGDSNNAGDVEH